MYGPANVLHVDKCGDSSFRLQMGVLDFDWTFTDVTTAEQDSLTASAAVVVQVMQDIAHFHKASDIFLGKTKEEIGKILFPVVERHVRLIYGQEKLEQILAGMYKAIVRELARQFRRLTSWLVFGLRCLVVVISLAQGGRGNLISPIFWCIMWGSILLDACHDSYLRYCLGLGSLVGWENVT